MLELDSFSTKRIETVLKVAEGSSASLKVAFSSYTHGAFDQETRIITGDLKWKKLMEKGRDKLSGVYPLIWEMQPPGLLNNITFVVPTANEILKATISSKLSVVGWWRETTPEIQQEIVEKILLKDKWTSARNFVLKSAASHFSPEIVDGLSERMFKLEDLYNKIFESNKGKRLSEISDEIYRALAKLIFGNLAEQFLVEKISYFGSEFGREITTLAVDGLRAKWLEEVAKEVCSTGKKSVFIGADEKGLFGITYNCGEDIFVRESIQVKTGQVSSTRGIEGEEVAFLLEEGNLRPTGVLFDPLIMTKDGLVIHDGNDYGNTGKSIFLLNRIRETGKAVPPAQVDYLQLFPDNEDSFAPLEFVSNEHFNSFVPSMVNLFLWNLRPGFWEGSLIEATKTSKTQKINILEEAKNVN